jgi:hypothetical protein
MGANINFEYFTVLGAREWLERLLAARAALLARGQVTFFDDRGQMRVIAASRAGATTLLPPSLFE